MRMAVLDPAAQGDGLVAALNDLYDAYRTALLNRKYYGCRLDSFRTRNKCFEALIAVGTSSAIGAWAIWREGLGPTAWAILAGLATLLAVIKPFLGLAQGVERYTKLFVAHGDSFFDLDLLVKEARRSRHYTKDMDAAFRKTVDRSRQLAPEDDPRPDERLLRQCFEEVKKEIPANQLWLPAFKGA